MPHPGRLEALSSTATWMRLPTPGGRGLENLQGCNRSTVMRQACTSFANLIKPVLDWAAMRHPLHLRSDHEREIVEFREP